MPINSPQARDALYALGCALPSGTRLGEFELRGVLGEGGFGIVYQAFDHSLRREVAIKEYLPQALAQRGEGLEVVLNDALHDADFAVGLESFVNEARTLARFDHPALLKVYRFWQAHGTAYMVMPLYRGQTLLAWRKALGRAPTEAEVRPVMEALLAGLQVLHSHNVLHGDVAPDNILIDDHHRPVLLDFGASRQVLRSAPKADVVMIKPAYAALEQQGLDERDVQGPWSDLYSLGASLYFMLMGAPPPRAVARVAHDTLRPLPAKVLTDCSPAFLQSVDALLALRSGDRPRSARVVLAAVQALPRQGERAATPTPLEPATEIFEWALTQCEEIAVVSPVRGVKPRRPRRRRLLLGLALGAMAAMGAAFALRSVRAVPTTVAPSPSPSPASAAMVEPAAATPNPAAPTVPTAAALAGEPALPAPPAVPYGQARGAASNKPAATASRGAPATPQMPNASHRTTPGLAGAPEAMPPVLATPAAAATPAPAPAAAGPSSAPAAPVLTPIEQCGGQLPLLRDVCMQRQCGKSEWRSHPQCVELRQLQEGFRQRGDG